MSNNITFYGPANQVAILRCMMRYGQCLTPAEFKVYFFIYDRTFSFKNLSESVPYRHFIDGVVSQDGTRWHFGIGIGETALKQAIRGLVEKGAIYRQRGGPAWYGTFYTINVRWQPSGIKPLFPPEKLAPDKRELLDRAKGGRY